MTHTIITPHPTEGYLHLGTQTPYGTQVDIENWGSLAEAQRWCYRQGAAVRFKVDDVAIPTRECLVLSLLGDHRWELPKLLDALQTAESLFEPRADYQEPRQVHLKNVLLRLQKRGMVVIQVPEDPSLTLRQAQAQWRLSRTKTGTEFMRRLSGGF